MTQSSPVLYGQTLFSATWPSAPVRNHLQTQMPGSSATSWFTRRKIGTTEPVQLKVYMTPNNSWYISISLLEFFSLVFTEERNFWGLILTPVYLNIENSQVTCWKKVMHKESWQDFCPPVSSPRYHLSRVLNSLRRTVAKTRLGSPKTLLTVWKKMLLSPFQGETILKYNKHH